MKSIIAIQETCSNAESFAKAAETQQSNKLTATSLASDRCGDSRAGGGQEVAEPLASGAPPSNTAPDNCNQPYFQALRWGIDSLYLSYPGELSREAQKQLDSLKELARSAELGDVAKAQLVLGSHIFLVKERGASLFPYILEDGAFRIQLSRAGSKAPMAYVKVSARFLAFVGPVEAEKRLYDVLSQLGEIKESANVSRIDPYVDFASTENTRVRQFAPKSGVFRKAPHVTMRVSGGFS